MRAIFRSGPSVACCHTHSSEPEADEDGDYLVSMMIVDLFRCVCVARQLSACSPLPLPRAGRPAGPVAAAAHSTPAGLRVALTAASKQAANKQASKQAS